MDGVPLTNSMGSRGDAAGESDASSWGDDGREGVSGEGEDGEASRSHHHRSHHHRRPSSQSYSISKEYMHIHTYGVGGSFLVQSFH
mgnify:FL=1